MDEFKNYHPIVNFVYFLSVAGFSMVFMNPVCIIVSLISSFTYSIMLGGKSAWKFNLLYLFPLIIIAAFINPVFNHEGVTILSYLPSGNPLTLESIVYGVCSACVLACVIMWFSCFNRIITSDKLMYLFGKITPALSLIFSMVLRFVPKFKAQIKLVSNAQKCVGRDLSNGNIIRRAKNGIRILSIMITWSLENAIDTADSMKSRGYGLSGRTAFSNFNFSKRDYIVLGAIGLLAVFVIISACAGRFEFRYYPSIKGERITFQTVFAFAAYFLLCVIPIIIEIKEAYRWKVLKSKI